MLKYRRKGKLYAIIHLKSIPHPGSDKIILDFEIRPDPDSPSFIFSVHFPNTLILKNRLQSLSVREIALTKVQERLGLGTVEDANIYVLPEDIPFQPYRPDTVTSIM